MDAGTWFAILVCLTTLTAFILENSLGSLRTFLAPYCLLTSR